ncbi:MAG: histidine kinase N-terminal 7TM domain-containing protein [Halobacteriota archaeon]
MQWQTTPYVLLLLMAGVVSFLWALYGFNTVKRRGPKPYLLAFVVLAVSAAIWSIAYAAQLGSTTLEAKLLAYKLLHVGALAVPPAWFAFALTYTGRDEWLTPTTIVGLVAIPMTLLVTLPTNPYSLALTHVAVETHGELQVLVTGNGPLYLLHLAYTYVVVPAGIWIIVTHAVDASRSIRRQSTLVVVGAVIPLGFNMADVFGVSLPGTASIVNLSPIAVSISTIMFGIAIFRYRMLDLTPIVSKVVLRQMREGVIVLDDRERIVDVNPSAELLVGDRDAVVGEDVSSHLTAYDELTTEGETMVTIRPDAENERLFHLKTSPLSKDGGTFGWVILATDVTDRERKRRALLEQNQELEFLTRLVNHDIRNDMSVSIGVGNALRSQLEGPERERLDTMLSSNDRVVELTAVAGTLLRSMREGTDRKPIALTHVLLEEVSAVRETNRDVPVRTPSAIPEVTVMADDLLGAVFRNIFSNAIRHRDDSELALTIDLEVSNGDVLVRIADTGPGIPDDRKSEIFGNGEKGPDSPGTGLGLYLVDTLVDNYDGDVWIEDNEPRGSVFIVRIPTVDRPTPSGQPRHRSDVV